MKEAVFLEADPGKIRKTITRFNYTDMNKRRFSTKLKPTAHNISSFTQQYRTYIYLTCKT